MNTFDHNTLVDITFFAYSAIFATYTFFNPWSNYSNFFSFEIKHIIGKYSSFWQYQALHCFNGLAYALYIACFSLLSLVVDNQQPKQGSLSQYDIFVYFARHFSVRNDTFFVLFAALFFLYFLFIERQIYFECPVDTLTLQKYYELVVKNYHLYANFFKVRSSDHQYYYFIEVPKSTKVLFSSCRSCVPNVRTKILFRTVLLRYFPNISDELRLLYIRLAVVIRFSSWIFIVYAALQIQLVIYNHRRILCPVSRFPLWFYPFIVLDLLIFSHLLVHLVALSLLMVWCATICSLLYICHLGGTVNRLIVSIHRRTFFAYRVESIVSRRLWFILVEHTSTAIKLLTVNRELWSSIVYLTVLVHVPSNAYLQFLLWAHSSALSDAQQTVTRAILANQFFFVLAAFLLLSKASAAFHRCARYLPALQCSVISKEEVRLKLKYMQLYERVNSEEKYGITIGPTSTITYLSTCQLFCMYLAFLLKIFDVLY